MPFDSFTNDYIYEVFNSQDRFKWQEEEAVIVQRLLSHSNGAEDIIE